MPRRLSGNPSKQLRKDLSRESSGPTHATNRIPRSLRIPYLHLVGRFTSTVAFQTHRGGRDRDSLAFRTAGTSHAGLLLPVSRTKRDLLTVGFVPPRIPTSAHGIG